MLVEYGYHCKHMAFPLGAIYKCNFIKLITTLTEQLGVPKVEACTMLKEVTHTCNHMLTHTISTT